MKLTNRYHLPQTIVNVLQRPNYTKGKAHLSVTERFALPFEYVGLCNTLTIV